MKVFKFASSDPDRFWCPYLPEGRREIIRELGQRSLLDLWEPWHLEINTKSRRKQTDFFSLKNGVLTLSEKAYGALKDLILAQSNVETLPCTSDHGSVYIVNIWNKIKCFDTENSIYKARKSGAIDTAEKYVFFESELEGQDIFKFPEGLIDIFVSDTFVELAEKSDLVGLNVELVWSTTGSENQQARDVYSKHVPPAHNVAIRVYEWESLDPDVLSLIQEYSEKMADSEDFYVELYFDDTALSEFNQRTLEGLQLDGVDWPENLVAIGHDGGGNLFCIDRSSKKISFFDHENSCFGEIAEDFDQLIVWLTTD